MISWVQAGLLALMGVLAASTIAALGTSIGNYTLNRPLIASLFVGLILGDVEGCIQIAVPMQIIYIALVTPGGTVAADLRAVSYIGIPLAWAMAKSQGWDMGGSEASAFAGAIGAAVGTVGTVQFYGTAMMNLIWQHIGWARLDKGDFKILGKVEVVLPLISHFVISFLPVMFIVYYGADAIADFKEALPMDSWYMKSLFTVGSLLPAVGIAILLKSVVTKTSDLVYFAAGFALAKSMGLTLLAATAVGGVFALINYQITMVKAKAGTVAVDDEEDI
ncbi:PTS system mannose-specific IIC component [Breznakia sp. PF5-3]|uniref:PTS sugar transporter subunit IIC n=1 Tax=unclassified Breznakia TaxID=2623764 RepID=UPI002404C617|nr:MULTISPECIES: PTS sugar transporter subunit IIC [unclassified Breznakia]MDL2276427.1 PTS sugar transporter subunit IIC [Breznakia sp. OttesenSCG-928-G09]MDF9823813.1 PTS system mannose-specific IIC component [Breznakia sp. PM6-1]MDF9834621.1 PTS system mannose-specific IIC component [Breznakia sp. PF5-3]MDF9836762.1 PTS system mannose-specific IIC component [Breznakia sp. PFB2-8]MDF9858789.1 PTS system mannose-specific IIC component [Breznakia sp. PH5-24]